MKIKIKTVKTKHGLKLCPFCGGQAILQEYPIAYCKTTYFVKCINCYARSNSYLANPANAIEAWNRRFDNESNTQSSNS